MPTPEELWPEHHGILRFQLDFPPVSFRAGHRLVVGKPDPNDPSTWRSRSYKTKALRAYRNRVAMAFTQAALAESVNCDGTNTSPVALHVRIYGHGGDADNVMKEVKDSLQGVAFHNDAQVVATWAELPDRVVTDCGAVKRSELDQNPSMSVALVFLAPYRPKRLPKRRSRTVSAVRAR